MKEKNILIFVIISSPKSSIFNNILPHSFYTRKYLHETPILCAKKQENYNTNSKLYVL